MRDSSQGSYRSWRQSILGLAERLKNNPRRVLALMPPTTSGGMDQHKRYG
jgi:hypothetical protein